MTMIRGVWPRLSRSGRKPGLWSGVRMQWMAVSTTSGGGIDEKTTQEQNRQRALDYLREHTEEFVEDALFIPDDEKSMVDQKSSSPGEQKAVTSGYLATRENAARDAARRRLQKYTQGQGSDVLSVNILCKMLEVEHGAKDVVAIDVVKKAVFTDWLIVASGLSVRHVIAIADGIRSDIRAAQASFDTGNGKKDDVRLSGRESGQWVVVDGGHIIIHVMTEESREMYALEQLWSESGDEATGWIAEEDLQEKTK